MHNTMELLKQINKTKFLIPYEQLYIQSHHHHKQLIPEQYGGEYNLTYQLAYEQQVKPHPTKPPDLHPQPQAAPYQATGPTPTTPSRTLPSHRTYTHNPKPHPTKPPDLHPQPLTQ
jgi:hypothetical protein